VYFGHPVVPPLPSVQIFRHVSGHPSPRFPIPVEPRPFQILARGGRRAPDESHLPAFHRGWPALQCPPPVHPGWIVASEPPPAATTWHAPRRVERSTIAPLQPPRSCGRAARLHSRRAPRGNG